MTGNWQSTPLGGWAASRPVPTPRQAEIVNLAAHRESSARWQLAIEPRAIGAVERFDRLIGLAETAPVLKLEEFRPLRTGTLP